MDLKSKNQHITTNIFFLVLTLSASLKLMLQLMAVFSILNGGGVINSLDLSFIKLGLDVTMNTYHHVYKIYILPLIPIAIGLVYNAVILINNKRAGIKPRSN